MSQQAHITAHDGAAAFKLHVLVCLQAMSCAAQLMQRVPEAKLRAGNCMLAGVQGQQTPALQASFSLQAMVCTVSEDYQLGCTFRKRIC